MNVQKTINMSDTPATVEYGDAEYRIVSPGKFVYCAVTGNKISLKELCYWNVDTQEAYATPEANLKRLSIQKKVNKNK